MKANEFVKKFGWDAIKHDFSDYFKDEKIGKIQVLTHENEYIEVNGDDLKRLVESWELVEAEGGLLNVKNSFQMERDCGGVDMTPFGKKLYQAIADVESCQ